MTRKHSINDGFTLIELSIVLVIIGLLAGGVLVGRWLVIAAGERAQISQIEKYNQAVNTFKIKFGELPGDIPAAAANTFGFPPRGPYGGQGDGNGAIEGNGINNPGTHSGTNQAAGEVLMFWVDLSTAGLIQGGFTSASSTIPVSGITGASIGLYYPLAAIGQSNYVLVIGGAGGEYMNFGPGPNFYVIEVVTALGVTNGPHGGVDGSAGLAVRQAYDIDNKIDDGFPTSGRVITVLLSQPANWGMGFGYGPPANPALNNTPGYCYNNNGGAGNAYVYSMTYPSYTSCTLAFQFQ